MSKYEMYQRVAVRFDMIRIVHYYFPNKCSSCCLYDLVEMLVDYF